MADLIVDNHLDFQNKYELKGALVEKQAAPLTSYVLAKLYMDVVAGKAYIQDGASNIEITKQGTVTSVATSQPAVLSIATASTIPTLTFTYADSTHDGIMSAVYAAQLTNASSSFSAGNLVVWNPGAGANINGTASNITASLDQVPAPSANVNMNNRNFSSLATASSNGQAVEYSQFTSHTGNANIHTPLDDTSHAADRVISALEVDNRITLSQANAGGSVKPAVQDLAALKALDTTSVATYPDKALILVEDSGQYRLDRQASDTEDSPRIIQPTVGVGRWFRINAQLSDHNNMNSIQGGTAGEYYHLTQNQNQAASGTSGTPSNTNRFVTDSDARMTNSRTPTGTAGGNLGGTYPNPTVEDINFTLGTAKGGTGATTTAGARKNIGVEEVRELAITGSASLQYNFAHNLNNLSIDAEVWETTTPGVRTKLHFVDIRATTVNNVRVEFGSDTTGRTFVVRVTGIDLTP